MNMENSCDIIYYEISSIFKMKILVIDLQAPELSHYCESEDIDKFMENRDFNNYSFYQVSKNKKLKLISICFYLNNLNNFKKCIKNTSKTTRFCVARNPNTTSETLDYLSKDEYSSVRYWVAQNPNTTSETLDYLSNDEESYVRHWVAENHNCSMKAYKYIKGLETLEELSTRNLC